jgi:hypothetical protein
MQHLDEATELSSTDPLPEEVDTYSGSTSTVACFDVSTANGLNGIYKALLLRYAGVVGECRREAMGITGLF